MLSVVNVERRKQSENIGLNTRDQDFQRADGDHQNHAGNTNADAIAGARIGAVDYEAGQNLEQDVARHHRNEQTQCEAERANKERNQLYDRDQPHQPERRAMGHKQAEEVQTMLPEANDEHNREAHNRQHASHREVAGESEWMHANQAERQ